MSKHVGEGKLSLKKAYFTYVQQCCETNAIWLAEQPVDATCHIYLNYEAIFNLIAQTEGSNK